MPKQVPLFRPKRKMHNSKEITGRLWPRVSVAGPDECWLWTGQIDNGYGRFMFNRKQLGAHRVSWEVSFGPIPEGLQVLHSCDVRACCNPKHLFLGTQLDNITDMCQKGRAVYSVGSSHPNSKLTEETAIAAMARLLTGRESQCQVAAAFGVDRGSIKSLWLGKTWRHVWETNDATEE